MNATSARLLLACFLLLWPTKSPGQAPPQRPRPSPLSPEEIQKLEEETAQLCGLKPGAPDSRLPWFYSYTLAGKFLEKGDADRALAQLNRALQKKPKPSRGERVYGLWFLDYLPYSLLARIHESLEQPECARHAREVARVLEPTPRSH